MSEISDMYEQIELLQKKLIKTKLQEPIKAIKEKRELSKEEQRDFSFGYQDVELLMKILRRQVYLDYSKDETLYFEFYNFPDVKTYIFKIDGEYISIAPHKGDVGITDIESIRKVLAKGFYDKEFGAPLDHLVDIDLEQLNRKTQERGADESFDLGTSADAINEPEVTSEEDDYEYDEEYEEYYARTEPHDWDIIWNILRNKIVDYKANEMFGENCNFCEIGKYSDMPGEEQIAATLNSMSIETLKEYFKEYPEDIELFEQMRSKYPNIQSLDEREAEEHSAGDEFVANIVDYATKKVEVREQNAQAAQLAQDYEQQLPANEQSLDDE